ncbi:MAG: 3-dehydroquinate synthase [Bacteroidales bacterium]|nr:3-dehydroquinate synthase [Bacteroidales bacterium]
MMTHEELRRLLAEASRVFILTDENVAGFWLPELKRWLGCDDAVEMVIKPGECKKTLQTAQWIWRKLSRHGADRHAVMVNFGGGVITDLGGFTASCYQRGIRFIHVPTTLLAMVDASIGGKNGVDFNGFKNQIGTFANPLEVLINPIYLSTLPDREVLSGLAEMVKYGFIADPSMLKVDGNNYEQYLLRAGRIKQEIVDCDFTEQGCRKILNFGHTLGHAFEGWSAAKSTPLTHGESVALGMGCALWISVRRCGLSETVLRDYVPTMRRLLSLAPISFEETDVEALLPYLAHDKKNREGQTRWVLLSSVGSPVYDNVVPDDLVCQSVHEVLNLMR